MEHSSLVEARSRCIWSNLQSYCRITRGIQQGGSIRHPLRESLWYSSHRYRRIKTSMNSYRHPKPRRLCQNPFWRPNGSSSSMNCKYTFPSPTRTSTLSPYHPPSLPVRDLPPLLSPAPPRIPGPSTKTHPSSPSRSANPKLKPNSANPLEETKYPLDKALSLRITAMLPSSLERRTCSSMLPEAT